MQRVAIGRALVRRPKAMLMDEPIGALDAKLREEMRAEIKRLHLKQGSTTIYVTHDQIEAMSLADRIVIMHEGVLQQVGTPEEVYAHPREPVRRAVRRQPGDERRAGRRVAKTAARRASPSTARAEGFAFPRELLGKLNGKRRARQLTLGIRPEGVLVAHEAADGFLPVEAHIIEPLGSYDIVDLKVGDADAARPHPLGFVAKAGDTVFARIDPAQAHFFDTASGKSPGSEARRLLMAHIQLKNITKTFGDHTALQGPRPRDRGRRVLRAARRDRRRQDDDAAPRRRAGEADRGPGPHRRRRCRRLGRGRARRGAGAAAILALSALHGAREPRIPAEVEDPPRRADAEIAERVDRVAKTLRIEHLLERKTDRLSGGEMQRVSIGRAIVRKPRVFLMDEPLSALDAKLREALRTELKNLQMNLGATFLFVTHDQIEAMSMGDKIGVLNHGHLVQTGTPNEIYTNPLNTFVARAVGSPPMNLHRRQAGRRPRRDGADAASNCPSTAPCRGGATADGRAARPSASARRTSCSKPARRSRRRSTTSRTTASRRSSRCASATHHPARHRLRPQQPSPSTKPSRFSWNPDKVVLFDHQHRQKPRSRLNGRARPAAERGSGLTRLSSGVTAGFASLIPSQDGKFRCGG